MGPVPVLEDPHQVKNREDHVLCQFDDGLVRAAAIAAVQEHKPSLYLVLCVDIEDQ